MADNALEAIEKLVEETYGKRHPFYQSCCITCNVWKIIDELKAMQSAKKALAFAKEQIGDGPIKHEADNP